MCPAINSDGFRYWEYALCYVDDVLCISDNPSATMRGTQRDFKLKHYKVEPPEYYLGASLSKLQNDVGDDCWAMDSNMYCAAVVKNIEDMLNKKGVKLPSQCKTPLRSGYQPEVDTSPELKAHGIQRYQEMIGQLRWAVEIGRVDKLLEVALMSQHMALPREGHLQELFHIFGYLKENKKLRLLFDPEQPYMDERLFNEYDWFEGLHYKLRMFGVLLNGPTNVYCDNEAVYNNTVCPESTLRRKHHSIAYHKCRKSVTCGKIRVAKQGTEKNLADLFTKLMSAARKQFLLDRFTY